MDGVWASRWKHRDCSDWKLCAENNMFKTFSKSFEVLLELGSNELESRQVFGVRHYLSVASCDSQPFHSHKLWLIIRTGIFVSKLKWFFESGINTWFWSFQRCHTAYFLSLPPKQFSSDSFADTSMSLSIDFSLLCLSPRTPKFRLWTPCSLGVSSIIWNLENCSQTHRL